MSKQGTTPNEAAKVKDLAPRTDEVKGGGRRDFGGTPITEIKPPKFDDKG